MAKERMVTRTVVATEAIVLCLNIKTAEPENKAIIVSGTYKDEKALEKAVKMVIDTEELKVVSIVSSKNIETLYGMTEQKFIDTATVLPNRKANKEEEN